MHIKDDMYEFISFCKNKISFSWLIVCIILSHGLSFKGAIGIDDENIDYYVSKGLIEQDRVGVYLTNKIFSCYSFLPLWTNLIGIIFLTSALVFLFYILEKRCELEFPKYINTIILALFLSFPYIAKFAIFDGSTIILGYVIWFTSIAFYMMTYLQDEIKLKYFFLVILCLLPVFLFEKAYIVFFVQFVSIYTLLKSYSIAKANMKVTIKYIICIIISIACAYLLSKVIVNFIHIYTGIPSSAYTSGYIKYDFTNIRKFIISLRDFIISFPISIKEKWNVYLGEKIYILAVFFMFILSSFSSIQKHDFNFLMIGLINILLSMSVIFATGNINMPIRSYCANYSFFIIFTIIYIFYIFKNKTLFVQFGTIILVLLIGLQSKEMEEIYYQKSITFDKDKHTVETILHLIDEKCGPEKRINKPIIFMGFINGNNIGYGEPENTSMFNWDRNSSVFSEEESFRIYPFFRELGYSLKKPNLGVDYYEIRKYIYDMEAFPKRECIRETEDYIIVKLGDSLCEIFDSNDFPMLYSNVNSNELTGNIEWFDYTDNILSIGGWLIKRGSNSYNNNISLILKGPEESYRIRIDEHTRPDVTENIRDDNNYDNSGINLSIELSDYITDANYQVYLEVINNEDVFLYDLNKSIQVH